MPRSSSHRANLYPPITLLNTGLHQVHGQYVEGWDQRAERGLPGGKRDLAQVQGSCPLKWGKGDRTPPEAVSRRAGTPGPQTSEE